MEVELTPGQFDLLQDNTKIAMLVGGIGGGKSFTLSHYVLNQIVNYPNISGLVVANTYTQLSNATIKAITKLFDEIGMKYKLVLGGAKKYIQIKNPEKTTIFIYSLEKPDNIRGIEVGWIAGDEVAYADQYALDVCFGRLRQKNGPSQARFFTSPNGFNFLYDFIQKSKCNVYKVLTKDNKFIDEDAYDTLVNLYGGLESPRAQQELLGEFVNQTNANVYYAFKSHIHLKPTLRSSSTPIYISCDFNAGNMNYIAAHYTKDGFKVFHSAHLTDHTSNTFSMGEDIYKKFGNQNVYIIPDSTGKSRKTSAEAGITDFKILESFGFKIVPFLNPRIKDRQNTVNALFLRNRISIDPSCKALIKDIQTLSNEDDEGKVSHQAVCLGYLCWHFEPLFLTKNSSNNSQENLFTRK